MANLVVNKKIKSKINFCTQSVSSYLEDFQCFGKFFCHHNSNDGLLLLKNMVYIEVASQVTERL